MKAGDLVQLCLDESVGLVCKVEAYTEKGVYTGRLRYWIAWADGGYEWSLENELDVIRPE